jgi:hypothetical protein
VSLRVGIEAGRSNGSLAFMPEPAQRSDAPSKCPCCGDHISETQFVFYPKPHKVRCRRCHTELRYRVPAVVKVAFFASGGLLVVVATFILLLLQIKSDAIFWTAYISCTVLAMAIGSYAEAVFVQRRYQPVKA